MNKKLISVMLTGAMMLSLSACGGSSSSSGGANTPPTISGVADTAVMAGTEFNALLGVTASDEQDGDITSMITIESMPELDFKNGVATPEKAGEYELTYTVTDKGGETVSEYATLKVTKQTGEAALYRDFDFTLGQTVDAKGWEANIADGVDALAELKEGAFVFDITSPGEGDGDIQLVKKGLELKKADYKIKVWAKSTAPTYCHILAVDEEAAEWSTFGGAFNVVIDENIKPLELNFTSEGDGLASIMVNLGKITPNPDNPDDTTPENFSVIVDKVEIYEITGEESKEPVYTCDFADGADSVTVEAGDGAEASAEAGDGAAVVTIANYPTEGGVWSIKANIGLGDEVIEEGSKYYYKFTVKAENPVGGECLVESLSQYDAQRANFNGISAAAGEEVTIENTFVAEKGISDPVIRLQIGNPEGGATSNSIVIDNVEFGKVTGDLDTQKTIDAFTAFGAGTVDSEALPFNCFNGTDEDNELGVGTIYTQDGKFYYRIDQGGKTDWHNKLILGYRESPLVLESDSYYTVEITCKADKDVNCSFALNTIGGWDPRLQEGMNITTEEQTFSFTTTDTLVTDMDFEMLFQFGSAETAELGDVTIEFSDITIYQQKVMD